MVRRRVARLVVLALLGAVCAAGTVSFRAQVAEQPTPVYQVADPGSTGSGGG